MGEKEKRLLPGDFQRKIKYDSLDNVPKAIEQNQLPSFFQFPEDLKGFQFKDRDFLVFYFDDPKDYAMVRDYFEVHTKSALSHPELNSDALVNVVRWAKERKG